MFCWVFIYLGGLSWSSTPEIQFNWHPLLMTIGMIYLYGNCKALLEMVLNGKWFLRECTFFSDHIAILVYRGVRFARKRSLKLSHASIFGAIMFLVVIASWAVYDSHVLKTPPIPNLYSLHSWIGLIAIILFVLQVMNKSGYEIVNNIYEKMVNLDSEIILLILKKKNWTSKNSKFLGKIDFFTTSRD